MIKRIYNILLLLGFFIMAVSSVQAQSAITYPIVELGNCATATACRAYCNEVANRTACANFARTKGLVKPTPTKSTEFFTAAGKELGCTSEQSCKELCSIKENFAKCDAFAKKQKLGGGYQANKTTLSTTFVQKLQEKAGSVCTSYDTCKVFCDAPENYQTCSDVSKGLGLKGGIEKKGPGGCTTEASCKEYCVNPDHFQECSKYPGVSKNGQAPKFTGPGGCDSEQACRAYCEKNPGNCGRAKPTITSPTKTVDRMSQSEKAELRMSCKESDDKLPELLRDKITFRKICVGSPENFSEYAAYCKKNPSKCNSDGYKNYCTEFPDKCGLSEKREATSTPAPIVSPRTLITCPSGYEKTSVQTENGLTQVCLHLSTGTYEAPTIKPSLYPTRIITFVPYQLNFSEESTSTEEDSSTTETFNTHVEEPTPTPTRLPTLRPTFTPTRTPTRVPTTFQNTTTNQTFFPSPTKIPPTATHPPEPTKLPTISSTSGSNSGPGSYSSGSDDSWNLTATPQVRGVSISKSFVQMLYDFLFR